MPTLLTYDDLASFPDDGLRRELLDGELIVSPSPFTRHQEVLGRLFLALGGHVAAGGGGKVFIAPLDVIFSPTNVTEPDLLFIANDQIDIVTEKNIQGAPALVVEVMSNPRIDRVRKWEIYARFGVAEYWIVDPDSDWVEIYRLDGTTYGKPEILRPGEDLTYPPLPGFRLGVAALLAR